MKKNNIIVSLMLVLILSLSLGIFTACAGNPSEGDSGSKTSVTSTGGNDSAQGNDSGNGSSSGGTTDVHNHTFAETWTMDETHHWHACTGTDCKEVKDKAEHTFDEGNVTKEPLEGVKGEKTFTCTACQKTKIEEVPALPVQQKVQTDGYYIFGSCTAQGDTAELGDDSAKYNVSYKDSYVQFNNDGTFIFSIGNGQSVWHGTYTQNVEAGTVTLTTTKLVFDGNETTINPSVEECKFQNGELTQSIGGASRGEFVVTYYGTFKFAKKLPPQPSSSVDVVVTADDMGDLTAEKVLGYNVKLVASESKKVTIDANNKNLDGIDFTHRIKLNGTIDATGRYVEITVEKPSTIKVYAMSGSSSATRNLNLYTDLTKLKEEPLLSHPLGGEVLQAVEYKVDAGTYYLGSGGSAINIYGIYINEDKATATIPMGTALAYNGYEFAPEATEEDKKMFLEKVLPAYAGSTVTFNADGTCVVNITAQGVATHCTYTVVGETITIVQVKMVYDDGSEQQAPAGLPSIEATFVNGCLRLPADELGTIFVLFQVPTAQ